jgi:hypothetical protein
MSEPSVLAALLLLPAWGAVGRALLGLPRPVPPAA